MHELMLVRYKVLLMREPGIKNCGICIILVVSVDILHTMKRRINMIVSMFTAVLSMYWEQQLLSLGLS